MGSMGWRMFNDYLKLGVDVSRDCGKRGGCPEWG